jgi:hypothetical protein
MESYYTIIKIAPNNLADDSLSIGLLLHDGNQFWIQFSEEKKSIAKKLLGTNPDAVDYISKQITDKVGEINKELTSKQPSFFNLNSFITGDYFNYLSNYSNGLLRFSNAIFLNDSIDKNKFQNLFKLLIDKNFSEQIHTTDDSDIVFKSTIDNRLINRVSARVHTNITIKMNQYDGLYFNFNIDCIGRNGALIAAKSISFNKKSETIDKELGHYSSIISLLTYNYPPKEGTNRFFIIGDEPSAVSSKEHAIWEQLYKNPTVSLINSEESGTIASVIEEKEATTFLAV